MKQFIAIMLFSLMCCTTIMQNIGAYELTGEQVIDVKEKHKELKEAKKELKEFVKACNKTGSFPVNMARAYNAFLLSWFLHPVIDKHSPPPDGIC